MNDNKFPISMTFVAYFSLCILCGIGSCYFFVSLLTGVSNFTLFYMVAGFCSAVSVMIGLSFLVIAKVLEMVK